MKSYGDGLPKWTKQDEANLALRVARQLVPPADRPTYSQREPSPPPFYGCLRCGERDHSHASTSVGPYVICRCLGCSVLTLEVTQ